jgi:hypothetical protein
MKIRYDQLKREAWRLPDGKQKLSILEESIRIADQYLTVEDAYDARMDYASATLECGCPERLFIPFSWCLSKFEQQPGAYSQHAIMWHYKWIINQIWRLSHISLEQIEQIFDDFKAKCLQFGYTLRPYFQQKVNYSLSQGNMQDAALYYKEWRKAGRDSLSDCKACEQNLFGKYYFNINQNKKGMQAIKLILEGKMRCRSVPQNTYSIILLPLLKLGEYEQTKEYAKKALKVTQGPQYLTEYGVFMEYYTVADMSKAVTIYEQTIHMGLESRLPWDRFQYLLSARLFLQAWSQTKRRKKLVESEKVTLTWLKQETESIANAFDKRNGNEYCIMTIEKKEYSMRKLVEAYN